MNTNAQHTKRRTTLLWAVLIIIYGAFLIIFSQWRPIDGDEGYYASAARLIAEGNTVYRDFFYPQAPLLPYVYALAYFVDESLASLRVLSAIFSVLMVLFWSMYLSREYRNKSSVGLMAVLVCILNPYLASWNVVVKTYSLCNFLVTAALVVLYLALRGAGKVWYGMSGLLCSILVSVRSLYAPIGFVILAWLLARDFIFESRSKASIGFLVGLLVGAIPALMIFLSNPEAYVFNNLGYHSMRGTSPPLLRHIRYSAIFFVKTVCRSPYLILVILLALIGLFFSGRRKTLNCFTCLSSVVTASFLLASMVPFPLYIQYYTATLGPLLLPLTAAGISTISRKKQVLAWGLALIATLFSVLEVTSESYRDSRSSIWSLQSYRAISQHVEANTQPEDMVLSFWPGYVYESGRRYFPGLENHFGLRVSSGLSPKEHDDHKIARKENIFAAVRDKTPKSIIVGAWMKDFYRNLSETEKQVFFALLDENYSLSKEFDGVRIFLPR